MPGTSSLLSPWRDIARSFRHRNYALFFFGQGTSLIGTWMQRIALSWLVYRLTGSEVLLGVVGFASQILTFVGAPFAGVIADRADRRKVLIVTQVVAMAQAFILAGLTLAGMIQVWEIIVLSLLLGLVNAFDVPIRQSFVVEMIEDRNDLPNAIALNSFMFNSTRLIGPTLAGIVIAVVGEGVCFLLNGLTFVAVIAALWAMRIRPLPRRRGSRMLLELKEGMAYAFGSMPIRSLILLITAVSLLGMPYVVLMPVFAKDILQGGPETLGFLMSGAGAGALLGALFLASRKSVLGYGRIVSMASALFGASLIAFSWSDRLWLSLVLLLFTGFGMMIQMASCNTLLQTVVDDDKRGRVMSLYTMAFMGMAPFGSLLSGTLAGHFGAPWALTVGGLGCLAGAAVFAGRLSVFNRLLQETGRRKAEEAGQRVVQPSASN